MHPRIRHPHPPADSEGFCPKKTQKPIFLFSGIVCDTGSWQPRLQASREALKQDFGFPLNILLREQSTGLPLVFLSFLSGVFTSAQNNNRPDLWGPWAGDYPPCTPSFSCTIMSQYKVRIFLRAKQDQTALRKTTGRAHLLLSRINLSFQVTLSVPILTVF